MIQLQRVSKVYLTANREVRALDDLSLSVAEGEFVAVRGHSGSGKSTLLSMVGGLALPSTGSVAVVGREISAMSSAERARFRAEKIGFVFQLFHLLPYLTVTENVVLAAHRDQNAKVRRAADELLERFGLAHRRSHRPAELSAGERQRVAMARAMLNRPPLLLADEPTGNLDPENAQSVFGIMTEFHQQGGTILLVTHDEQAAACAQRTIELREGRLATEVESLS